MLGIVVHPADVQDRDGAEELLRRTRRLFPFIEVIFADGGYQVRSRQPWPRGLATGGWRSSSATMSPASRCWPNAGSSNEPWSGSVVAPAGRDFEYHV